MLVLRAVFCAALLLCLPFSKQANAQDITLTSKDGSVSLLGHFKSFDGSFYRIETDLGILTVDAKGVFCEGPACPDLDNYFDRVRVAAPKIVLDNIVVPIARQFAVDSGYSMRLVREQNKEVIRFLSSGDDVAGEFVLKELNLTSALSDLHDEQADIIFGMRHLTERENELSMREGTGNLAEPLRARVVALDAVVPLVNPLNSTGVLETRELMGILSGKITNWTALDWRDAPISLHVHRDLLAENSDPLTSLFDFEKISKNAFVYESYEALSAAILDDPYALGIGRRSVSNRLSVLGLAGECGHAAQPTASSVRAGDYPLVSPTLVFTPSRRLPQLARSFVKYAVSPGPQRAIGQGEFVDQNVEEIPLRSHGGRLANAVVNIGKTHSAEELQNGIELLRSGMRLSLGFRFLDGTTRLDVQSNSNVHMLAELMEAGVYDGTELAFIGFSDAEGDEEANRRLSLKRAQSVQSAVKSQLGDATQFDQIDMSARGFGELLPIACNEDAFGRALNRRVEVWVFR